MLALLRRPVRMASLSAIRDAMTQPDPSDRLTAGARTVFLPDIEVAISGGPRPEPRVIDLHARCRDEAAQAAAQTAAAVEALRALHSVASPHGPDDEPCWYLDVLNDLDAAAKQHDEAVADRAVGEAEHEIAKMVALIVQAAGGEVRVPRDLALGDYDLLVTDDPFDDGSWRVYRTRPYRALAQAPSSGSEEQERG